MVVLSRLLAVVYLAVIAYLCFARFNDAQPIRVNEKAVHFIMFFPYAFLLYGSLGKHFDKAWKSILHIVLIFISGCFIAALTEIIQVYIPYREGDILDFRADILSLGISSLLVFVIEVCQRKS